MDVTKADSIVSDKEIATEVRKIFQEHFINDGKLTASYDLCGFELMDMLIEKFKVDG